MASFKQTTLETTHIELPEDKSAPLLIDDWTLSFYLGLTGRSLWFAVRNRDELYKTFTKKKASGGTRVIHNPGPMMRVLTGQIRKRILLPECEKLGDHVTAYRLGRGITKAARRHLAPCVPCQNAEVDHTCSFVDDGLGHVHKIESADCVACQPVPKHACPRRGVKIHMDLKDFFGSTKLSWVRQYFHEKLGYSHYVSSLLAKALTVTLKNPVSGRPYSGVPQGGKASGDITNLVADYRLDQPLLKKLPKEWTYSRYADDLYFSHPENLPKEEVDRVMNQIRSVVKESGYRVNHKKTHVQRPHKQQKLLGIVVNERLNIPRDVYRRMRSMLRRCWAEGFEPVAARMGKNSGGELRSWIEGKLAYFSSISPQRMKDLKMRYQIALAKHPPGSEISISFGEVKAA